MGWPTSAKLRPATRDAIIGAVEQFCGGNACLVVHVSMVLQTGNRFSQCSSALLVMPGGSFTLTMTMAVSLITDQFVGTPMTDASTSIWKAISPSKRGRGRGRGRGWGWNEGGRILEAAALHSTKQATSTTDGGNETTNNPINFQSLLTIHNWQLVWRQLHAASHTHAPIHNATAAAVLPLPALLVPSSVHLASRASSYIRGFAHVPFPPSPPHPNVTSTATHVSVPCWQSVRPGNSTLLAFLHFSRTMVARGRNSFLSRPLSKGASLFTELNSVPESTSAFVRNSDGYYLNLFISMNWKLTEQLPSIWQRKHSKFSPEGCSQRGVGIHLWSRVIAFRSTPATR